MISMSSKAIILEDCLISFLLLSTYLILVSGYMGAVYNLKTEVNQANLEVNQLKACMVADCQLSVGNNTRSQCVTLRFKTTTEEVCVQI